MSGIIVNNQIITASPPKGSRIESNLSILKIRTCTFCDGFSLHFCNKNIPCKPKITPRDRRITNSAISVAYEKCMKELIITPKNCFDCLNQFIYPWYRIDTTYPKYTGIV